MESIIALAKSIKKSIKPRHGGGASEAAQELTKILDILVVDTPTPDKIEGLSRLLRYKLIPLYQVCTEPTLRFSSKILDQVLINQTQDRQKAGLWTSVAGSIASGILVILQFLKSRTTLKAYQREGLLRRKQAKQDHRSRRGIDNAKIIIIENARTTVARYFYSALFPRFLPDSLPSNVFDTSSAETLTAIYQLLSDSVVGQPNNQSQFWDSSILGGRRIGLALANLRDFLAVESLLELFANLLPSAKIPGGKQKRRQFIEEVFTSSYFENSKEIIDVLENIKVPDWNVTSLKISDLIAMKKPSYPRPFSTSRLAIDDSKVYEIERIYLDGSGFFASIDEGDTLGTIQIPYSLVEKITVEKPISGTVTVISTLKAPPIINRQNSTLTSTVHSKHKCTWTLNNDDTGHFLQALKLRNLDGLTESHHRKVSLLGAELELTCVNHAVPLRTKIKGISDLWSNLNPMEPTSPLFPDARVSLSRHLTGTSTPVSKLADSVGKPSPVVVKRDSVIRTNSLEERHPNERPIDVGLSLLTEFEPENTPTQELRRVTRRTKATYLVLSNDEDSPGPDLKVQKTGQTRIKSGDVVKNEGTVLPLDELEKSAKTQLGQATHADTPVTTLTNTKAEEKTQNPTRKRAHLDVMAQGDAETETRPSKRSRTKQEIPRDDATTKPTKSATRYRAKGRTSSPIFEEEQTKVDYEAPPNHAKKQTNRMKAKDGKPVIKPRALRPRPIKKEGKGVVDTDKATKETLDSEPGIAIDKNTVESTVDLADVPTKFQAADNLKKNVYEKPQSAKAQQAPWEAPSFVAKVEWMKSDNDLGSINTPETIDPDRTIVVDEHEKTVLDSPAKAKALQRRAGDVEMIDLTHDDSPSPKPRAEVINNTKRRTEVYAAQPVLRMRDEEDSNPAPEPSLGSNERQTKKPFSPKEVPAPQPQVPNNMEKVLKNTAETRGRKNAKMDISVPKKPKRIEDVFFKGTTNDAKKRARDKNSDPSTPKRNTRLAINPVSPVRSDSEKDYTPSPIAVVPRARRKKNYSEKNSTQKIMDILDEINEVMLGKITVRFENVRSDIRIAQRNILNGAVEKLKEMRVESVKHYNSLVALDEKYVEGHSDILRHLEDMKRGNEDLVDGVSDILLQHGRQSLSRKFPKSMFKNIPDIILNPCLLASG